MAGRRKTPKAPTHGSFLNLAFDSQALAELGAESENIFTEEEMEGIENAKGFLSSFGDDVDESAPVVVKEQTPQAEPDAISSLKDFFK